MNAAQPAAHGALSPGTVLGKYRVIKRIAVGGMAEIYLAQVIGLAGFEKIVVLKRILPQLAAEPAFVSMFLDEARIAATLDHPNIVQVVEVGEFEGNYFMAMEYLHGETVRSLMRTVAAQGTRIPIEHALYIITSVCQGLHYAHEKVGPDGTRANIVHRDISPHNLMITFDGAVKLLDFGIAKASTSASATRSGTIKGKVGYMSPEQCVGEPLDRRSDVFSLGIVLWELTLGRRLFGAGSDFERMRMIVDGEVPVPHDIDPEFNSGLEAIVMRCLDGDPARRYQTARALQEHLEWLIMEERIFTSSSGMEALMASVYQPKLDALKAARVEGRSLAEVYQSIPADELGGVRDDDDSGEPEARAAPPIDMNRTIPQVPKVSSDRRIEPSVVIQPTPMAPAPTPSLVARPQRSWAAPLLAGSALLFLGAVGVWAVIARQDRPAPTETVVAIAPAPIAPIAPSSVPVDPPPPPPPVVVVEAPPPAELPSPDAPPTAADPAEEEETGDGKLVLATSPWCNVVVDGQARGVTPLRIHLSAGKHSVLLTNPDKQIRKTIHVDIKANHTVHKRLSLTP